MRFGILRLVLVCSAISADAAITIANVADKTKYDAPHSFTVTADPNAATTDATLDGFATPVGTPVSVAAIGYHELKVESRAAAGAVVDAVTVRFISRDPSRAGTEDGIPAHTPFRSVNDAPSAFAGQTLKVIAPAAWPVEFPTPIAAVLRSTLNETVRLNGVVTFGGLARTTLQLRRGWGSVLAPALTGAGPLALAARVNGLTASRTIQVEAASAFTNVSGPITANTTWPPNSRIHLTGTLTIEAGATLTVGAGTIVLISAGTGSPGSAAEVIVHGTLQVTGNEPNPVVFAPDTAGEFWGGIELPSATSQVNATHTIFTGSGEDPTWFDTHSGYSSHKPQQALFLISGSGSGTTVGAQLHLSDCYCFNLAGQEMNSRANTWIDLQRTLMQRAITCGELNGSKVTIDRCALIEFPSEDETFVDADNDALYLTNGDLSVTNTVIGFGKDDGIDSGGNGGDNPFTAAADVTPLLSQSNWYEGTFHEGHSLSGTRNVAFNGCVFLNCGQGIEGGYSTSATGDGPNALVDGCLFVSNMVGVRWGDNYGSGYSYNQTMEVKNSLLLNNRYHDAFSGQWHPTQTNAWIYQTAATNSFGRPYFNLHDSLLSQPDPVHHPANLEWNPSSPAHLDLLATFMPVPGSAVGVAISSYTAAQQDTSAYPGTFSVRLSTFSSRAVGVNWSVIGKLDPFGDTQFTLASGALTFAPGETLKTISAPVAAAANYGLLHVALTGAANAEVTGDAWFFKAPTPDPSVVPRSGGGWRYRETRTEPPAAWKQLAFDDSSSAAIEWLPCTLPAGYGTFSGVTFGTPVNGGPSSDRTRTFYFRKRFNVPNPAAIESLSFRIRRDDGAIAWLNNGPTPIANSADPHPTGLVPMPASYATLAPNAADSTTYHSFAVPIANLVTGDNILTVEVHQSSITSGDLLLDCELVATYSKPLVLRITRAGGAPVLYWPDTDATLEETTNFTTWTPVPGVQSPLALDLSVPKKFFRLRK